MSGSVRNFFFLSILLSAVIYSLAAWNNEAYLHPDEHYQIIEFASYRLGYSDATSLPWEYNAHIRSAFQPVAVYVFLKGCAVIGVADHYMQLFLLRFFTAMFSLAAISLFCYANMSYVSEQYRKLYILITFFMWMPYIYGTHYSSEAWSGNFILLAISSLLLLYERKIKWPDTLVYLLAGMLIGLAFLCRFQTAFFGIGLGLWLLFFKKEKFSRITSLAFGAIVVMGLGVLLDSHFYHTWVYTPWLYVKVNIIDGVASSFGIEPVYQYVVWLLTFSFVPLGVLLLFFLGVFFVKYPRHIHFWLLVPFLLGHSLIGHKEERFMYPAVNLFPIAIILAYQSLMVSGSWLSKSVKIRAVAFVLIVIVNAACLIFGVLMYKDYNANPRTFAARLHRIALERPITVYYTDLHSHPFIQAKGTLARDLVPGYLREDRIQTALLRSPDQLKSTSARTALIATNLLEMDTIAPLLGKYKIRLRSIPAWVEALPIEKYFGANGRIYLKKNTFCILEEI